MKAQKLKKHLLHAKKLLDDKNMKYFFAKSLLECWNAETPHFGGDGPHRYGDNSKFCEYCMRPLDWTPINAGLYADLSHLSPEDIIKIYVNKKEV